MQCSLPFDYLTDIDGQHKYCDHCERTVYPVKTKAEFDEAIRDEKCVWFDRVVDLTQAMKGWGGPILPPEFGTGPDPKRKPTKLSKKPLIWKD